MFLFFVYFSKDEYIYSKNIGKPVRSGFTNDRSHAHSSSGLSKFDRYKHQDASDDEFDEGEHDINYSG